MHIIRGSAEALLQVQLPLTERVEKRQTGSPVEEITAIERSERAGGAPVLSLSHGRR
jgi:hypothetical protein